MEAVTPVPTVGTPLVNNGGQRVAQFPLQLLTPGVSLVKIYKVIPAESTRNEPRFAVCPRFTRACPEGVAIGIAVATGAEVAAGAVAGITGGVVATGAMGVSVAPVIGTTGARVLTGVAVGAAVPQADATSATTRRAENISLFFITLLLVV